MNKTIWRIVSILLGLALLVAMPWFVWLWQPSHPLQVVILDKTVPDRSYREHKGLVWLLNQQKIVKPDGTSYRYEEDYYGFYPGEAQAFETRDIPRSLTSADVVYIADTYGVYEEEYYGKAEGGRSDKLIGGLTLRDLEPVQKAAAEGATLIAEFNTFASPTDQESREVIYDLLGLEWSGWIGRIFADLKADAEIPAWMRSNYEVQYGSAWSFEGAGLVLVNEQDQIVVLEAGKHLQQGGSTFAFTTEGQQRLGLSGDHSYRYWFDIVQPRSNQTEVLASYKLDVTAGGQEVLARHGIPVEFPAVLRHDAGSYQSYYFAGDYADINQYPLWRKYWGWETVKAWTTLDTMKNEDSFYWDIYVPLMKSILREVTGRQGNLE